MTDRLTDDRRDYARDSQNESTESLKSSSGFHLTNSAEEWCDEQVYHLDSLAHLLRPPLTDITLPTFIPHNWKDIYCFPSQMRFDELFGLFYGPLASIFTDPPTAMIAGPAMRWLLNAINSDSTCHIPDLDVYFICAEDSMWAYVDSLKETLALNFSDLFFELEKGLLTFHLSPKLKWKVKVHWLNIHNNLVELFRDMTTLQDIDIGSNCVAYNGRQTFLNGRGVSALCRGLNYVDPNWIHPRYSERMVEVFEQGFGLILPHLIGFNQKVMQLSTLQMNVTDWFSLFLARGCLSVIDEKRKNDGWNVDQHMVCQCCHGNSFGSVQSWTCMWNVRQLRECTMDFRASGGAFSLIPRTITQCLPAFSSIVSDIHPLMTPLLLPCESQCMMLRWIFGLTNMHFLQLYQQGLELLSSDVENELQTWNLAPILQAKKNIIFTEYKRLCVENTINVDWFDRTTVSHVIRNEWYGKSYTDTPVFSRESFQDRFISHEETVCSLCQNVIDYPNGRNVVRLQCGHCFHFMTEERCVGILPWIKKKKPCPNCRAPFERVKKIKHPVPQLIL